MNKSANKSRRSMTRCPRCGSRRIQSESRTAKGIIVIHCQDCDSVLQIHDRGAGRADKRKHRGEDHPNSTDFSDHD